MDPSSLRTARLRHHRLVAPAGTVGDAASRLTATQSQDFWSGRLAIALRTRGGDAAAVDRAYDRGLLVRSWTQRGTLHTVAARDLGWMLRATRDRMLQANAARMRELALDDATVIRAERLVGAALSGGNRLARAEVLALWREGGVSPDGQRGAHLLLALAVRGVVAWGPVVHRAGREPSEQHLVLVDEWIQRRDSPSDPRSELFVRYILGHGPATVRDFAWWSGLTLGQSAEAASAADERVVRITETVFAARRAPRTSAAAERTLALPTFDEYYISYADRSFAGTDEVRSAIGPGANGMVRPVILHDGAPVGIWKPPPLAQRRALPASFTLFPDATVSPETAEAAVARSLAALRTEA